MTKPTWTMLTKRTDDPKLAYIEKMLDKRGIPHRRNGESFHAPILEVPADRLDEAWSMLSIKVNRYDLDTIRDDAPMFTRARIL